MFLLDDGTVVYSASDLANAAACEFAVLRALDAKLGRVEPVRSPADAMLERAARLGDRHEERVLAEYRQRFGDWDARTGRGVASVERPSRELHADRATLESKHAETMHILRTGADVLFQAGFFDGRFGGWADFLVREPTRTDDGGPEAGTHAHTQKGGPEAGTYAHTQKGGPEAGTHAHTQKGGPEAGTHAHTQKGGPEAGTHALPHGDAPGGFVYGVYDTKLARHAKITALLQVAAYADQLLASGIEPAADVHLILGDRTTTSHRLADLLPVYRDRRRRLETMLDDRADATGAVAWGERRYRACGRCEVCAPEIEARRDVLLVAGMRTTQRARLLAAGIATMDQLAASHGDIDGIGTTAVDALRAQARLQVAQDPVDGATSHAPATDATPHPPATGAAHHAPTTGAPGQLGAGGVRFDLFAPEVIRALPRPDPGDIFFDFEGDPLWAEEGSTDWGLEYLFGVVEQPLDPSAEPVFRPFWAHDRAQEKHALLDFLAYLTERRATHPHMHVYHYAAYEKTALLRLAGRHGVGEESVDQLLRDGVLVDLYATVRASLRTGQRSYSIKKLEPLYMDSDRTGEVTTAGDSIVEYAQACLIRDNGDDAGWRDRLALISEYNEYDCVSTLRLRDWLLARAAEQSATPGSSPDPDPDPGQDPPSPHLDDAPVAPPGRDAEAPEHDELADLMLTFADHRPRGTADEDPGPSTGSGTGTGTGTPKSAGPTDAGRTVDQQAAAMLAASLGYHWRESKPFWWAHFDRLSSDPQEWTERRSTFLADPGTVEVIEPWHVPPGMRVPRRRVRLVGRLEPGSELRVGAGVCALYDEPVPPCAQASVSGRRGWTDKVTVVGVEVEGVGEASRDVLVIEEVLRAKDEPHTLLPMALGPGYPPTTRGIALAIRAVVQQAADTLPRLPHQPAIDLIRRTPPRMRSGQPLPAADADPRGDGIRDDDSRGNVDTIVAAVLDLDGSYLAVQGPPGTGKTYTGARVIAELVSRGWRIGVVAQSHAVVENMLRGVADAGVPVEQMGKKPSGDPDPEAPWRWFRKDPEFSTFYRAQDGGYVVGGTVWDFTNANRLPDEPLDLLVVDEAGQFALANTVAVSGAARNLLLLGDPQQLPQVSQGRHPEPVDRSALGWLTDGHDTLPADLGYFLAQTWRMHPALCAAVSHLSYEDRLTSMGCTAERSLEGIAPGVHSVLVQHRGNAVASVEEAAEVVTQVRRVVGKRWRDPAAEVDRPLTPADVVVVAAYNAQVWTIRRALGIAGLSGARVGTVDKFQGRQAPVVIVSMAASSADDVPRGMEFLLNRNRVNVAISRGQWCAVVVRSVELTDYLPTQPEGLAELGAFLGLTQ